MCLGPSVLMGEVLRALGISTWPARLELLFDSIKSTIACWNTGWNWAMDKRCPLQLKTKTLHEELSPAGHFQGIWDKKKVNLNFLVLQAPSQFGVLHLSHGHESFPTAKWAQWHFSIRRDVGCATVWCRAVLQSPWDADSLFFHGNTPSISILPSC